MTSAPGSNKRVIILELPDEAVMQEVVHGLQIRGLLPSGTRIHLAIRERAVQVLAVFAAAEQTPTDSETAGASDA